MKKIIAILSICIASSSAFAQLDKACGDYADKKANELSKMQTALSDNASDLGFDALFAQKQKQDEDGYAAVEDAAAFCVALKEKSTKVSPEQAAQILDEVFVRMNAVLGLPNNSGAGSAN